MASVNTGLACIEYLKYGGKIKSVKVNERPVFVLGHPRTGTTHLHNLLALDSDQFIICTTFCAGFPSSFLWFENLGKRMFSGVIDKKRPMVRDSVLWCQSSRGLRQTDYKCELFRITWRYRLIRLKRMSLLQMY